MGHARQAGVHLGGAGGAWGWGEHGGAPNFYLTSLQPAVAQRFPAPEPVAWRQTEVPGATWAAAVSRATCSIPQAGGCRAGLARGAAAWTRLPFLLGAEQRCQLPVTPAVIPTPGFAMLYPNRAVVSKLGGCVLAGCAQNQEFQVSSNLTKERVISRRTDGNINSHSYGLGVQLGASQIKLAIFPPSVPVNGQAAGA